MRAYAEWKREQTAIRPTNYNTPPSRRVRHVLHISPPEGFLQKRKDLTENFTIYLKTGLGKPHSLVGDLNGWYGIAISGNIRLIVKPDMEESDDASFEKCDSVIIRGLVDYHGRKNEWLIP